MRCEWSVLIVLSVYQLSYVNTRSLDLAAQLIILSLPSIERPWRACITAHGGICQQMSLPSIEYPAGASFMARSHRAQLLRDFYGYG
jgi:hypothetical protein